MIRQFFGDLPRDAKILMISRGIRAFAFTWTSSARFVHDGNGRIQRTFGISPTISTYLMQTVSLTLPLFTGGGLQLLNDLALFLMFRHVKPPEELAMNERSIIEGLGG